MQEKGFLTVSDKEMVEDELFRNHLTKEDLTQEEWDELRQEMEWKRKGDDVLDGVLWMGRLNELKNKRQLGHLWIEHFHRPRIRELISRCQWTFAKTMPWAPHEYIVWGKYPLTEEEFLFIVDMQRQFGKVECWGKYVFPYLYVDGYKYWTMGAPVEETTVINRAKVDK